MYNCKERNMLQKVEYARERMIKLADEHPLNSKVVVEASTELDKLLNLFAKQN